MMDLTKLDEAPGIGDAKTATLIAREVLARRADSEGERMVATHYRAGTYDDSGEVEVLARCALLTMTIVRESARPRPLDELLAGMDQVAG